ncbi:DNA-directed RNA polymerase subunit alpha, partial [Marinomonas arenicola]
CAIVEVEIDGVLHEYSAIEGVKQDVIEILLNLKGVAIALHGQDEATLTLSKKGPGIVTAGDIQLVADAEIANPDHVIAHLDDTAELSLQIKVARGRGYEPADARVASDDETR